MSAPKGKQRAQDSFDRSDDLERAPLLAPPPTTDTTPRKPSRLRHGRGPLVRDDDDDDLDEPLPNNASEDDTLRYVVVHPSPGDRRSRFSLSTICCAFFAALFVLLLLLFAALHLWVGHLLSEQARHDTPEDMAQRGLVFTGPSDVRLAANAAGDGVTLEMDGTAGVDVRAALGWEHKDDRKTGWLKRVERKVARWGVRKARTVAVNVGEIALFDASVVPARSLSSLDDDEPAADSPVLVIPTLDTLTLPLSYPSASDPLPVLEPFTLHVPLTFPSPDEVVRFGKAVWEAKTYRVRADVRSVQVRVGSDETRGVAGWFMRRMGGVSVGGLTRFEQGDVPDLPIPSDPTSQLHNLTCSVFPSPASAHPNESVIAFSGSGLLQNPLQPLFEQGKLPPMAYGLPFRLPISVSLALPPAPETNGKKDKKGGDPDEAEVRLAKVAALPFSFAAGAKEAPLAVAGHLVPAGNASSSTPLPPPVRSDSLALAPVEQPPLSRALSRFVARYLSNRPNSVYIRYDPRPEPPLPSLPSPDAPAPPPFLAKLLADQVMEVKLPGTNETPELFRNLRMEDMRVKLGGMGGEGDDADLLASGRVVGEVVLPDLAKALEEGIDARSIWPDVLVYDGDLPGRGEGGGEGVWDGAGGGGGGADQVAFFSFSSSSSSGRANEEEEEEDDDLPCAEYPPSPIPANAFARMRPLSSMPAITLHTPANATHNATTLVSASFVDAPLYLLPGRGDVLRRFVAKIVFGPPGQKVKASMKGQTSVRVGLEGFGEVSLSEIPIEAAFMVGRGGVENPPLAALAKKLLHFEA
ncbi:hypothetical protein JCM8097_000361 [Rhodosporidiobolus ruineniae]